MLRQTQGWGDSSGEPEFDPQTELIYKNESVLVFYIHTHCLKFVGVHWLVGWGMALFDKYLQIKIFKITVEM